MGLSYVADIPGAHEHFTSIKAVAKGSAFIAPIFSAPFACKVTGIAVTSISVLTGRATNSHNLNYLNKGVGGSGATEIANIDFGTGTNLVASVEKVVSSTLAVTLAKGTVLTQVHQKLGSGLAFGESIVRVTFEPT